MLNHDRPSPSSVGDGLDAAALAQLRELDPTGANRLLERVVQAFDASLARLLPQLQQAGMSGNLASARLVAHTLKSSAASLGALQLSRQCAELENQIRGDAVAGLDAQIQAIVGEAARVKHALARLVEEAP